MYPILRGTILITWVLLLLAHKLEAQNALPEQTYNIRNVKISTQYQSSKKVLHVRFDCYFGRVIKDLELARYKFYVLLDDSLGQAIYHQPKNYAAIYATEHLAAPGQAFTKNIDLFIPYVDLPLKKGLHPLTLTLFVENKHERKSILEKEIALQIDYNPELSYKNQEFEVPAILIKNEKAGSTEGIEFSFDIFSKYAYDEFKQTRFKNDYATYYIYLILKDTQEKIIYQPDTSGKLFEKSYHVLRPAPNPNRENQLVQHIAFFIPRHKISFEDQKEEIIAEVYVRNSDGSHIFPVIKRQAVFIALPSD